MTVSSPEELRPARQARQRADAHRRALMEAEFERVALELFVEHGYRSVSIEQIADVAGVSARTFYRYFPAKEDVLGVHPRRLSLLVREAMLDQPPERPPYEALSAAMLTMLASVDTDELTRWLAVTTTPEAPSGPVLAARLEEQRQEMEPLLRRHMGASSDTEANRHLVLIFGAAYLAVGNASREWFECGGDLVGITREWLDIVGRGLSTIR